MPLSRAEAVGQAAELRQMRDSEKSRLELIHLYLRDDPDDRRRLEGLPSGAPDEVVRLARIARVNVLKYIVNARSQHMYVDGFQTPTSADDLAQWEAWQRSGMDARQIGVHRAGLSFGASYATVLPGEPMPVIRGASPRHLTVAYGDDDMWPVFALEKRRGNRWRLFDEENVYSLTQQDSDQFVFRDVSPHGATFFGEPVCPVVRFRDTDDLDNPIVGIVEPHFQLQNQINVTSFALMVAQHYGAFRQRYILGWLAETEEAKLKASASKVWSFEDPDVQVGEFSQTDLRGYIESREASLRHLATVSQTPVHELLGQFVNLSAEALEAARSSHHAAIDENRIMMGESWEQVLNLAGEMAGIAPDPSASVVWRDTRVRSLAEAAEALGALAERLGIPRQELWPLIPGVAQHQVERWKQAAQEESDSIDRLAEQLQGEAVGAGAGAGAGGQD